MKPGNKRTDAWYARLSDSEMWAAYDACSRLRPWERGAAWIKEQHRITVCRAAYYRWLDWCRENEMLHTLGDARRFAAETKRIVAEVGDVDARLQEGVAALALDAASTHDVKALGDLVAGLGKLRKDELDRAKLEIKTLRTRVSELEATLGTRSPSLPLTPVDVEGLVRVQTINICDLLDALIPGYWSMDFLQRPDYTTTQAAVTDWCRTHGAYHYAEPREEFSRYGAACAALRAGLELVVLEDLS